MKRKLLFLLCSLISLPAMISLTACSDDDPNYVEIVTTSPTVKLEQTESGLYSITVKFTPDELTAKTVFGIGNTGDLSLFENGTLPGIKTETGDEEFTYTFEELDLNTSYTVFARPYSTNDEEGILSILKVSTLTSDFTTSVQFLGDVSAGFIVTSTDDYYRIDYAIGTPADKAAFENGTFSGLVTVYEQTLAYVYDYDLTPNTDYVFFAKGWKRDESTTGVTELAFKTYTADAIPSVEVEIEEINGLYIKARLTPNDKVGRIAARVYATDYGGYPPIDSTAVNGFDGNWFQMYSNWSTALSSELMGYFSGYEQGVWDWTALVSDRMDTDWKLVVMVYDKNMVAQNMKYYDFHTPAFDQAAEEAKVLSLNITNITNQGATYDITVNDPTVAYFFETYEDVVYEELEAQEWWTPDQLRISHYYMYLDGLIPMYTASTVYTETEALADTKYYVVVTPMNTNGTEGWGETFVTSYTTLP